jgi:hypothetical protein
MGAALLIAGMPVARHSGYTLLRVEARLNGAQPALWCCATVVSEAKRRRLTETPASPAPKPSPFDYGACWGQH